jgi:hypothetical protein
MCTGLCHYKTQLNKVLSASYGQISAQQLFAKPHARRDTHAGFIGRLSKTFSNHRSYRATLKAKCAFCV